MNSNFFQSKILVQCPHCKSMVRQDRLKNHTKRVHALSLSGKPPINLQHRQINEDNPSAKFGMTEGSILEVKYIMGVKVRYEYASCSCNGDNERCIRCDGTGFYVRKIIDESNHDKSYEKRIFKSSSSKATQESSFSNDYRGSDFGIREVGRFNSNPLYDDHE